MSVIGIEEIFLKVKNMEKAIDFYHGILGIPVDKQDDEKNNDEKKQQPQDEKKSQWYNFCKYF